MNAALKANFIKGGSRGASYLQKISKSKEITYVYLVYVRKTKGSYNILATPEYQPSFWKKNKGLHFGIATFAYLITFN